MTETMLEWERAALLTSWQVACLTVLLATPIAVGLTALLTRARWTGHWVLDALLLVPAALPPAVLGFGLLMGLTPMGEVGHTLFELTGWQLAFFPDGVLLASTLTTLPLMIRQLRPAFESIDPMLHPVAASLGTSPWRVWWGITLPMLTPAVLSAASLGLALAWGESGATLILGFTLLPAGTLGASGTVPLALVEALQSMDTLGAASRLALISVLVVVATLLASEGLRHHWMSRYRTP